VLWATVAASGNLYVDPTDPGVLHAYDAGNVSTELWNSTMNPARDNFGNFAKFVPPLVANGKVYVATFSNQVAVYGLLSSYTVSPRPLAFGNELTNVASAPKSVTVTNTGPLALPITSITLSTSGSQPFSQTNNCGTSIAAGASCTLNVTFDPSAIGSISSTLSINVGNGVATQTVALSGTGIVPTYTLSAASLAFGNELTNVASAPKSVTLTNTGVVALPISSITLSTSGSQPFAQTNPCGSSVAIGASCTIAVVFNPASTGPVTATLGVNAGSGAATHSVALSGTGVVPTYTLSPTSLAFGNELINVASAPQSVTLTNSGGVALPISSITLSTSGSQPFAQTNTCGSSVAIGASCTIAVVFNPASTGSGTALLSVNAGSGAATQTVALSGTGIVPTYTLSAASLAFGNELTNVASAPKSVTLTNTGVVALPLTSITLSTSGAQPFSQTNNCGSSVAIGASCTINVVFNPASTGSATAMLSVNAGCGAVTHTLALNGTGIVPTYTVSAATLAFGNELTNVASAPQSVTLTNTGVVALPITSITLSTSASQPFAQTNTCGSSVAMGASCTIAVVFNPASTGSAAATLSINFGNGIGTQTVALNGTGIVPTYTASSSSLAFGTELTNVASTPQSVTVTNTGVVTLPIAGITLSTSGSPPFTQTNTCGSSVAVGASCSIGVVFDPSAQGSAAATLNINFGNGIATQTVALNGTGIVPTVTLAAAPSAVAVGQLVTLTWTSSNAASCVAVGGQSGDGWAGTKPTNGTATVTPNAAGAIGYTLSCASGSQSVQITVQPPGTSDRIVLSGGGALDTASLLSLLALLGLRQRKRCARVEEQRQS
jgi:methionine-rich copper-binding protein CopC